MQRFNNFTKKSGKVASAILSAAMVTSMLAGTNVVYAATEATEATTDVKTTVKEEEKGEKAIATLKENYKNLPVTVKTSGTEKDFTDVTEKVKKDLELSNEPTVTYGVTTWPTATKAGEAVLKIKVTPTTSGAIVTDNLKYTLASGNDRAAAAKAEAQKYIDEELEVTNLDEASAIAEKVADHLSGKNTQDNGIELYKDVKKTAENLTVTKADGDKRGAVTGTISFKVVGKDDTQIGGFDVTVDKEILTNQEVADAAKEELDKYIDGVKYFVSSDTEDATTTAKLNKVVTKFIAVKGNNEVEATTASAVKVTKTAGKTRTGEALVTAELQTKDSDAKAKIENKVIAIPSDNAKVESVLADYVEYAESVSVDADTDSAAFEKDFAKAYKADNKDINMGTENLDTYTSVKNSVADVYGAGVSADVVFTSADDAKDNQPEVVITVDLTNADGTKTTKTAVVNTFNVKPEESKGSFEEKDGKKYYYDANGNTLQNTYLQGTDSPDGYTYYIQADGSVMQDRLTYTPDGKYIIYFDEDGHEVFDAFVNVKKDMQGNDVDYIAYFDTFGHAYTNITTYGNGEGTYSKDSLFYINDYGVLQTNGWFKNAEGNIGYAAENGALTTSQWGVDQFGRKVYFQANGFLAKGLITDGVKYYQLDENDGHLVGEF